MTVKMRHVHFETIDSTNSQARALAAAHPGEVLLITATQQSAGRGRHGRTWQSPRGGAWMSIAWPTRNPPRAYTAASLVVALAVHRALCEVAPQCSQDLMIKWPNDLLLAHRKLVGILCEQCLGRGEFQDTLIVGIGVNVDIRLSQFSEPFRHPATTLREEGALCSVDDVIEATTRHVLEAMAEYEVSGWGHPKAAELRRHLAYVGTIQSWTAAGRMVTGRVLGVDDAGRLLLDHDGVQLACDAGELLANTTGRVSN